MRCRLFALVLLAALFVSLPGEARDLDRMVERLEAVRDRLQEGASPDAVREELSSLRDLFAARVSRLDAKLDEAETRLQAVGLSRHDRLSSARAAFEAGHLPLLDGLTRLTAEPDLDEVEECLRALRPLAEAEREDHLSAQELPLRAPELEPPALEKSGVTDTSTFGEAGEADASVIGSGSEAIQELAASVDGAVGAYELVKNQTRFELYFGSMKGAEQTLREGSGNDADIHQLLVQLLRAKGVPARYVRGVVRISLDQAMNLLGVERVDRVEQALTAAGVPYEPVVTAGGLSAIELEHVWAEAYVSWSNYRGVALDDQGKRWVPLDASFKFHRVIEGERVLESMGFDAEAFVLEQLEAH